MSCVQKIIRAAMKRSRFAPTVAAAMLMLLSACTVVGPDYVRPTVITPDAYKEIDGWRVAQPKDDLIRGAWWEIFGDPQLNALVAQVSVSNQNLAVAEAQYREAQALVREARASYFPTATIGIGANRSSSSTTTGGGPASPRTAISNYSLPLDVSWEIDVWGRIRRTVESNQASAQASAGRRGGRAPERSGGFGTELLSIARARCAETAPDRDSRCLSEVPRSHRGTV